jgi:hypothetical protein
MSSCRFAATKEEDFNWIIGRPERQSEPLDLVGHDYYSA